MKDTPPGCEQSFHANIAMARAFQLYSKHRAYSCLGVLRPFSVVAKPYRCVCAEQYWQLFSGARMYVGTTLEAEMGGMNEDDTADHSLHPCHGLFWLYACIHAAFILPPYLQLSLLRMRC